MLVSQIIEVLQERYTPDTELFVEWWDKEGIEYGMDEPMTNDTWSRAVEIAEDADQSYPNNIVREILFDAVARAESDGA